MCMALDKIWKFHSEICLLLGSVFDQAPDWISLQHGSRFESLSSPVEQNLEARCAKQGKTFSVESLQIYSANKCPVIQKEML